MSVSSLRIAAGLVASAAVAALSLFHGSGDSGVASHPDSTRNDEIAADGPVPARLSDTGFLAGPASDAPASDVLPFAPQYPLWSDGATKRRWIYLPKGTAIDGSAPTAWRFPVGTKLWKEFSFGTAVEMRYSERLADGRWVMAAYVSDADHRDATLAPARGIRGAREIAPGVRHDIPGRLDCLACHGGRPTPVLGFNALDLSSDRDPLAAHAESPPPGAIDLARLIATGRLRNAPAAWTSTPPRIAASSPRARAALGYLHANCSSCHRAGGELDRLGLAFDAPFAGDHIAASETTANVASRFGPRPTRRRRCGSSPVTRSGRSSPDAWRVARR